MAKTALGRKKSSSTPKKQADKLMRDITLARDKSCRRCGGTIVLQAAHVISRRYAATRHDERNVIALCRACHAFQTHHPLEGDAWFEHHLGQTFWELRALAIQGVGRTDWAQTLTRLRARAQELGITP